LSKSYFSIPIYADKTNKIERLHQSDKVNVFVFLKKIDFNSENKNLLQKILSAVKINLENDTQVLLLEDNQDAFVIDELDLSFDNYFFAFGLNAKRIGLQSKTVPYKLMAFDKLNVLYSHTLTDLQSNIAYKKQLWGVLKEISYS
jgi:DNA polymerase III psi subunit